MAPTIRNQALIGVIEMGCEPVTSPAGAPDEGEQNIDKKGQGESRDGPNFEPRGKPEG